MSWKYCVTANNAWKYVVSAFNAWKYVVATGSDNSFITTWQTENTGSATKTIVIPTNGAGYDCYIDWGEGGDVEHITGTPGDITHIYTEVGIKTIRITGLFPNIYFNNSGDKLKLLTIAQWGDIVWGSTLNVAFYGCTNMNITASDAPDFSVTTVVSSMFNLCTSLNKSIGHWDMSHITSIRKMLVNCTSFNQDLGNWDVTNITDARTFIENCTSLSPTNYDALLIGWAAQDVQNDIVLDAGKVGYTSVSVTARGVLINTYNWTLNDSGQNFDNGKLIITWDDGVISQYTEAFPVFVAQGVPSTFYINSNLVAVGARMTWVNLQEMDTADMDIQDHFADHTNMTTLTEQQVLDGLNSSNADFVANSLPSPNHLAYPFGANNANVQTWAATLRQTGRFAVGSRTEIFDGSAKFSLPVFGTDGMDDDTMVTLKSDLDLTQEWGTAIITYSHIAGVGGLTVDYLNELIDYAQSIGMDVITMAELYVLLD